MICRWSLAAVGMTTKERFRREAVGPQFFPRDDFNVEIDPRIDSYLGHPCPRKSCGKLARAALYQSECHYCRRARYLRNRAQNAEHKRKKSS